MKRWTALVIMLLVAATLVFAAGEQESDAAGTEPQEEQATWDRNESPMLYEQVQAGELPPLEQRLPANPLVIEPVDTIGTYGGTLRRGTAWIGSYLTENFTRESLTQFRYPLPGAGEPYGNLAESWEYNDDATEVTVYLREGIKWSDGESFTTEDIAFYWYDICLDEQVAESLPGSLLVGGEPPELVVIDDYTLKFVYPTSYYYFPQAFASIAEIAWPKHYIQDSHPKYNPDASYEDVNGFVEVHLGRGRVTLQAWMVVDFTPGEQLTMVRNPYYFKVDTEGNQLPYFDHAVVEMVEDRQSVALGNVSGEFDLDNMWVGIQHIDLFMQRRDQGDYELGFNEMPGMGMWFNLDHSDPAKKSVFRDVRFRRAFSVAIDREEINQVMYNGILTPTAAVWSPATPYYNDRAANMWIDYDPDEANALLDEAALEDVDGDGLREAPNGEKLQLVINVGNHDLYTPSVEMVVEDLREVGLDAIMNVKDQSTIDQAFTDGDFDISTWDLGNASDPFGGNYIHFWAAVNPDAPPWHQNWEEDPIDETFLEATDVLLTATAMPYEERVRRMKEVAEFFADNVWAVHIGYYRRPFIQSNSLGNTTTEHARTGATTDMPPFKAYQLFREYESRRATE